MTDDRKDATTVDVFIRPSPEAPDWRSLKALTQANQNAADDDGWRTSRSPANAIADEALAAAMPRDLRRRLMRGDPVVLVVDVPGPDWVTPIADSVEALSDRNCFVFRRDGSKRRDHVPGVGNAEVADTVAIGIPIIGVSPSPAAQLPSSLLAGADATITVAPPDGPAFRRVLARCGHRPVPRAVPAAPCVGLSFTEIVVAFRKDASGRDVLSAMDRMRARKAAPVDDGIPTLDKLPGFSGEARVWAEKLVVDWRRWRTGEIASFAALDSKAMLYGPPGVGKTMLVRSLARTLGIPLHETSPGAWMAGESDGTLGGASQAFLRSWQAALVDAKATGAVWYLDEADGLPDRARLTDRAREWWTSLISLVNSTMSAGDHPGLCVIGSCNAGSSASPGGSIDAAIRRRFGRTLICGLPTADDLSQIVSFHTGGALRAADVLPVMKLTSGASAAAAAIWARDAMNLARDAGRAVTVDDVLAVAAPPDMRSPAAVRRIALHEAAHAVVAHAFGQCVDLVTIVESGAVGGLTRAGPQEAPITAEEVDRVVIAGLAGRAAEESILGSVSGGAEGDLATATSILAAAHASAGLGSWLLHRAPSSEATSLLKEDALLRDVVEAHLTALYREALALVAERRAAIERVADALTRRRLLDGAEVRAIVGDVARGGPP